MKRSLWLRLNRVEVAPGGVGKHKRAAAQNKREIENEFGFHSLRVPTIGAQSTMISSLNWLTSTSPPTKTARQNGFMDCWIVVNTRSGAAGRFGPTSARQARNLKSASPSRRL